MKIVVLAGGISEERNVSLSSGSQIANALMKKEHEVLLIDLAQDNEETSDFDSAYSLNHQDEYLFQVSEETPSVFMKNTQKDTVGKNVLNICKTADIVFIALHGGIGENGQIQALFDIHGIRYTGSGYKSSLLAMDKVISKELMAFHHIPTPKWTVIKKIKDASTVTLPAVVKPNDSGSSIGVEIVSDKKELSTALKSAFNYSQTVLVEERIIGREFSVGIVGEKALPVIEVIPKAGFYDYKNKYQAGFTEEITPAHLNEESTKTMQKLALQVHHLLGLTIYSRIDFMMDDNENIYFIEANSLPGMTPTSLIPQEAAAAGISYIDLCEMIVENSLAK
ncbi:D-alanine--D-alanine ligase [Desemzia sp. FAM 24101]|uniref:D-alanine--D-alanine ligase family protein n=1 Tax=unclassified Desemzia TaxID=2685243 RepID=UPI00388AFDE4